MEDGEEDSGPEKTDDATSEFRTTQSGVSSIDCRIVKLESKRVRRDELGQLHFVLFDFDSI